jgi:hypothetical protein
VETPSLPPPLSVFDVAAGVPCHGGARGAPAGAPDTPASHKRPCCCARREHAGER